jgi:thioredoxin-dependent peroxiredoxin
VDVRNNSNTPKLEVGGSMLKPGDKAPDFSLQDDQDNTVKLRDYEGKTTVVLFFYPKADTPG